MDKGILQRYSVWAKESLEQQVEVSLKTLGINSDTDIARAKRTGDVTTIEGDPNSYSADLYQKRNEIINLVKSKGYKNVIEEFSYTWFNRFVALRFMEVHDFLGHGFRVLSNRSGGVEPEILQNLGYVKDDLKLDMNTCSTFREQNKVEELFRYVLIQQCNALSNVLPMLFSRDMGYLELLLPKTLLRGDTVVTKMLDIPEEAFLEDVEIIGWMYQFYISGKKDAVNKEKKTITKDTLPAVTQLFTPDWIVRYMAENSVGRIWMESYPSSQLRSQMKYYVDEAKQTEEVQRKLDGIKYRNVNPEDIRIIEPCCGSGHILVYVFDLLYKMYEEKGYQAREIPTLILSKNLYGLDVDKRAAQLSSFALIMKARVANSRFFTDRYYVSPNVFEIIDSSYLLQMQYRKHLTELNLLSDKEIKEIDNIVDLFKNGKTIGSLLKIKGVDLSIVKNALVKIENNAIGNIFNSIVLTDGVKDLKNLVVLAEALSSKYDVMITNPPYIGISSMEAPVKEYAIKNYPNSKTDMFAMFMETKFVKAYGFKAMINMHSWMFLDSYEKLRYVVINSQDITSMVHLGARGFDTIGGEVVQTTSFTLRNGHTEGYKGVYYRLLSGSSESQKVAMFLNEKYKYITAQDRFANIPGYPISYRASSRSLDIYAYCPTLKDVAYIKKGMFTGCNELFFRLWFEPSFASIDFGVENKDDVKFNHYVPMNSGGPYRRWYGNRNSIIKFDSIHYGMIDNNKGHRNPQFYFRQSAAWTKITTGNFSIRLTEPGFINNDASMALFENSEDIYHLVGLLNGKVAQHFLGLVNESLNYTSGNVASIPFVKNDNQEVKQVVNNCIQISKEDWDSFEISWDFIEHPLVHWSKSLWDVTAIGATMHHYYGGHPKVNSALELCYMLWQGECKERFDQLKNNEEKLNRIFIDIYGLQDELTPEVEDKDVTVRLADKERDIKSLVSYLVGVVMGRYSINREGLQFAGGQWDVLKYGEPLDDDGIIPIYSTLGMEDSLTTKIITLIKDIFGEDDYRSNIDFIADALGKKSNESSEETLNRYLNEGFYNDHLKIYQKRPIYWMFSSGKNSGFKCLIYMHRYNADTLARINGKYFLPESTRIKNELDEINTSISTAEGRDRIRLEKERQKLAAKYNEAIEYGQVLDHMANKFIDIDLDDGVKVNYAKFQGVELVTDNGTKVKKDLLVSIK